MTDNKQRMPSDAKSPHWLWHSELKRILKCEYLHKKSSPLKLPSQMNRNLVGSIYICMEGCLLSFLKAE
jgi:hypothetical protein